VDRNNDEDVDRNNEDVNNQYDEGELLDVYEYKLKPKNGISMSVLQDIYLNGNNQYDEENDLDYEDGVDYHDSEIEYGNIGYNQSTHSQSNQNISYSNNDGGYKFGQIYN